MTEEKKEVIEPANNEEVKKTDKKHKHESKESKELAKALEDLAAEKEKSLRITAEMMNFKKRQEDLVLNIRKYANEDLLLEIVKIIDDFERALSMETEENKEFLKGFYQIYTKLLKVVNDAGASEIDALNKPFDPAYHSAIATEHVENTEAGIVIEVLQKGYMYKDKLLRPSMVKVSE